MAIPKSYRLSIRFGSLSMTQAAFRHIAHRAIRSHAGGNLYNPKRGELDAITATLRKLARAEPEHFTPSTLDYLGALSNITL